MKKIQIKLQKLTSLLLSSAVALSLCLHFPVNADTFGNWEYYTNDTGVMIANFSGYDTEVTIPENISGMAVTELSPYTFMSATNITSITIPASITNIGNNTFSDCSKLTTINVSADNQYYSSVDGILFNKDQTEIISFPPAKTGYYITAAPGSLYNIPDTVKTIAHSAFANTSLENIYIPESVTSIGQSAFAHCENLTTLTLPSSIETISYLAFHFCTNLKTINLPSSLTSLGNSAFADCHSLNNVTLPNSLTKIGEYVFYNCTSLSDIKIPNSVTLIDWGAFDGCTNLETITIPSSVATFGYGVFIGSGLKTIYGDFGSAAETFANENNFTFQQAVIIEDPTPLYGDVNEDTFVGKTDDIVLLAKYLSNGIKLSETALANANCDMGDTRINASDLQAIVNYLLNDISSLPVE